MTNIPLDTCTTVDACGICNGDNSTCRGCDGLPNGKTIDSCGVCGGLELCRLKCSEGNDLLIVFR